MEEQTQEVSTLIREIVSRAGQITGTRLAVDLRERAPGWSPKESGFRKLRDFIDQHVEEVCVVRRAGMDVVYAIRDAAELGPAGGQSGGQRRSEEQGDLWRLWVSPNSPKVLAIERPGNRISAVPRGSVTSEDRVVLEPPNAETHRKVATHFVADPSVSSMREHLADLLASQGDRWWQEWVHALRKANQLGRWNAFRRECFERELADQLGKHGFAPGQANDIVRRVRATQAPVAPAGAQRSHPSSGASPDRHLVELRRILGEAVLRMSISELRDLRLPLGVVLDIIRSV